LSGLALLATDTPQWTGRAAKISMAGMFQSTKNLTGTLQTRDVSQVVNMSNMFADAKGFNLLLSGWDTAQVTTMAGMFSGASDFNQSLGMWNISNVTTMNGMLSNTALTTYNYNELLFGRGKQTTKTNLTLDVAPTQYAGCEVNAGQGILGHGQLSKLPAPAWRLMDGGMEPCAINGHISYNPT
jgi:surface protein